MALLPIDYRIDEETVVQPDNLIVCDEPLEGRFLDNAPRVIFEILSPATIIKDTRLKYELYESVGVENYVIVDPERKHMTHYRPKSFMLFALSFWLSAFCFRWNDKVRLYKSG